MNYEYELHFHDVFLDRNVSVPGVPISYIVYVAVLYIQ
jgi:hypothetical protein